MITKTNKYKFTAAILGGIALAGASTGIAHAQTTPQVNCTAIVGPVLGITTGVACTSFFAPFYPGSGPVVMVSGLQVARCDASNGVQAPNGQWTIEASSCT